MEKSNVCTIITALRNGDDRALSRLYDLFYGPLYYFVQRIVDNTGEAQEITADSFVKYWRQRDEFESLQNIKAFLYVTARNACFDCLRNKKKQAAHREHLNYFLLQSEDDAHLHDEIKSEVLRQIHLEIENLPHQCRKIFKLSFLLGFKNAEIAEQLGLTLQTVKNQKTRAVKLLKLTISSMETQLISFLCFVTGLIFS